MLSTRRNTSTQQTAPKPVEESVQKGYETPERLIFREEFEKTLKWIDERIANTNYIMGVIIVVLFVGFVTLFFAVFAMFQQAQNANVQSNLQRSVEDQSQKIKTLEEEFKNFEDFLKNGNPKE